MRDNYTKPSIVDYGSIRDHTFSRCNPTGATGNPPKDDFSPTTHFDMHMECSETVSP